MAAFVESREYVYNKMRQLKYPFYKVVNCNKAYDVYDHNAFKDHDIEEAIEALDETLNQLQGKVTIIISNKKLMGARGGDVRNNRLSIDLKLSDPADEPESFRHKAKEVQQQNNQAPRSDIKLSGNSAIEIIMQLMAENQRLAMEQMKNNFEFQRQMDDIKRLGIGSSNDRDPLIERTFNILEKMFNEPNAPAAQPIQIAGHPQTPPKMPEEKKQLTEEDQKALNWAIHTLLQKDPDFIANLVKLAKLAESKPFVYEMAIKQLNQI